MIKKSEILAPAGGKTALISAISAGCDAIYLGYEKFSARSGAKNFNIDDLRWAVSYAHLHCVKIYLTINTIIKNSELNDLVSVVEECIKIGVDAFIIQDIGVLCVLKSTFPEIVLHASTQMNIHSSYGANFVKGLGVERLILARELSLEEISIIKKTSKLEVESFVHGALCYCYSGQCLMSSSLGDRSGNRGSCAQPCRLAYDDKGKSQYVMSLKDLSAINMLEDLVDLGIDSLKIEGRVKGDDYVYKVVSLYRKYLDKVLVGKAENLSKKDYDEILQVYNRGDFSTGFYKVHNDKNLIGRDRPKHGGIVVGKVEKIKGNSSFVRLEKPLKKGDYIEFSIGNKRTVITADNDYNSSFKIHGKSKLGAQLRRLSSVELSEQIKRKNGIKHLPISIYIRLQKNEKSLIKIKSYDETKPREIEVLGDTVEQAKNMPISYEKVYNKVNKTMDYPFEIKELVIDMNEDIFMPISKLNELRRMGLDAYFISEKQVNRSDYLIAKVQNKATKTNAINVAVSSLEQAKQALKYPISTLYVDALNFSAEEINYLLNIKGNKKIYAIAPKIVRDVLNDELLALKKKLSLFDGILVKSIDSFDFISELNKPMRIDYSLNIINNESIKHFKSRGVDSYTPSLELSYNELREIDNEGAEILIYAHITTMTSASCIKKTTDGCYKKEGAFYNIGDRKGEKIYYETKCTFCYNKIYNPYPLYLIDKIRNFNKIGVDKFRLDFNFESPQRMKNILDEVFYQKKCSFDKFTRGHFEKGIR